MAAGVHARLYAGFGLLLRAMQINHTRLGKRVVEETELFLVGVDDNAMSKSFNSTHWTTRCVCARSPPITRIFNALGLDHQLRALMVKPRLCDSPQSTPCMHLANTGL